MEPRASLPYSQTPPLVLKLNQMEPVHSFKTHFSKIYSNIILPPLPKFSKWSLPFRVFNQIFVCISYLTYECYMTHLTQYYWFDRPNNKWWSVEVMTFQNAVSSRLPPLPSPQIQIFSSDPVLKKSSVCVLPLRVKVKLSLCLF